MTLPILLSVPHAGWRVPPEAQPYCQLTEAEILHDGDEGAAEIYDLAQHVAEFVTTDVARAIVDLNRAEDDRRPDGVVKTHTCWNAPVYREFPSPEIVATLLDRYYRPYHVRLSKLANESATGNRQDPAVSTSDLGNTARFALAVDCHTMAAVGPPIAPDPGQTRPEVCLGDANGATLPDGWMDQLLPCFRSAFGESVTVNKPFSGGYITRMHGNEMPWLQVELSRAPFASNADKRTMVLRALTDFCEMQAALA